MPHAIASKWSKRIAYFLSSIESQREGLSFVVFVLKVVFNV